MSQFIHAWLHEYAIANKPQIWKLLLLLRHFVWMDSAYGIITFNMLASIYVGTPGPGYPLLLSLGKSLSSHP